MLTPKSGLNKALRLPSIPNANRLDKKSNINALKNRAIKLLYKAGAIDQSAFQRAQREPFKNKRYDAVYKARHYAAQALKNGVTHSNLDLNLQILLENAIKNTAASLKSKDANNAAGIIIDNKNMSVAASGSVTGAAPLRWDARLTQVPTEGLELIDSEGSSALWRITACD